MDNHDGQQRRKLAISERKGSAGSFLQLDPWSIPVLDARTMMVREVLDIRPKDARR